MAFYNHRRLHSTLGYVTDLLSPSPVMLPGDAAGILARRILRKLLEQEAAESSEAGRSD